MRSPRLARIARGLAALVVAALALGACAPADDAEVERARAANELARDLMSPFCPGRTLADCSSPDAAVVREEIRDALRAGEAPKSIRARIEARFGDRVVGVPRERLGWILPILVLLAGAVGLALLVRRALRRPVPSAAIPAEVEARLLRELDELERDS